MAGVLGEKGLDGLLRRGDGHRGLIDGDRVALAYGAGTRAGASRSIGERIAS